MRINMRNWNEDALLLVSEQTQDEMMKKYIKSILIERFTETSNVRELYKKIREGKSVRNDILWSSITNKLIQGNFLIELKFLKMVLNDMPMDYLASVAVSSNNIFIKYMACEIGHQKQEAYEREIGIYDKTYEKYALDEKELKLERRMVK